MLHLVPLVAFVSISTASIPTMPAAAPAPPVAGAHAVVDFPWFRLPFFGRKKESENTSNNTSGAKTDRKAAKPAKLEPLQLVDRRLRDLVIQQEAWFVQNARYGKNAYRAGLLRQGDSTAFADVRVEILYAGKNGWTAVGSHPDAPWKSCVVFVGFRERLPIMPRTHESAREATLEGIPACDDRK